MAKICIVSQQHFRNKHVSEDSVDAFENSILNHYSDKCIRINLNEFIFKINRKLSGKFSFVDHTCLKEINRYHPDVVFIMAMSPEILRFQAKTLANIKVPKLVYCIDTWESRIQEWKEVLAESSIDYVICSNLQSVECFKRFTKKVGYLPYSMNEKYFYPRLCEKEHLFMQMGRKNKTLDDYVHRYIQEHNLKDTDYIREKVRGQIIYSDFNKLAEEINKTWFFLVAPRDIDELSITGKISDVTARFYEGISCKTMLIGYKPKDTFDTLFPDKCAMQEVKSYEQFCKIINFYLERKQVYFDVVNKNYEYLMAHHTWRTRVKQLSYYIDMVLEEDDI